MANRKIIVYSASCKLCEEAERIVRDAVAPCGCSVEVRPIDSDEARALGVNTAPTIVRDGKVVLCGLPTSTDAIWALRKPS